MRLVLRLDDGGLIGHVRGEGEAGKLSAAEALEAGRLGEGDRQRLYRLLETAGGFQQPALHSQPSAKRKDLDAREAPVDAKRLKPRASLGNGRRATSELSPGSSGGGFGGEDWGEKCRVMVHKVLDALGVERQWFDRPVDEYYIPGYYSKIRSPMDLGTMLRKLETGKYKGPQAFCDDMRLVWENCIAFNGKGTKYGKIGDRMSAYFEELWAASGLDTGGLRHRRSTAGVAAAKYEPQEDSDQRRPLRKAPSARAAAAASSRSARLQDEASSIPMDREQMRALAEWMGSLDGEGLEGVFSIIRERGLGSEGPNQEVELDFDAMDNETLWALDDYMVQAKGGRPAESGGKANSGFQVDPESEYESESDGSED